MAVCLSVKRRNRERALGEGSVNIYTEDFVRKLNTNIERYKTALKRRQGRKASDKTETAIESENGSDSEQ